MKKFLLIGVIILVAVTLSGCKKAAEKTAETAIEAASGGEVDVDIENDSMKINTNAGSLEVGEGVSLPANFPDDIYLIAGDIMSALTVDADSTFQVEIDTPQSLSDAASVYDEELQADGWTITSTLEMTDATNIMAEKDDRFISVSIGTSEGITVVIISTSIVTE